ncbi:MAG: PEP-CTERM sorting domain-containing protein [Deltaproteobacteria bacterium]|nr:PEP-CTERM sorting domain-containing protein [Deltaproteobacteria bacterium]
MRKLFGLVAATALVLGAAQPASAVVLTLASASLSITIGSLPPVVVPWNGLGNADVTATSITDLTAGIFNFSGSIPVTDPGAFPIAGVAISGATNASGTFTGVDTASGGGLMAVIGTANVCLFASCAFPPANVTVPFTTSGVNGVGLGGAPIVASGLVNVTSNGNSWTTGTATAGSSSLSGTPFDGTYVKLVTPVVISTNIGASAQLPMFGILELTFNPVPEPGTLLLLASGVAGLAMVGRKRMSK